MKGQDTRLFIFRQSHFLESISSSHLQSLQNHDGEVLQRNKPLYDAQYRVIIQLHSAEFKYPTLVLLI